MIQSNRFDKFRPLGDRVLLKRVEGPDKTIGGLYIPESAQEKAQIGKVVSVGAGKKDPSGKAMQLDVKAGDTVYFSKYAGTDAGDDHLILREDEILGILG